MGFDGQWGDHVSKVLYIGGNVIYCHCYWRWKNIQWLRRNVSLLEVLLPLEFVTLSEPRLHLSVQICGRVPLGMERDLDF